MAPLSTSSTSSSRPAPIPSRLPPRQKGFSDGCVQLHASIDRRRATRWLMKGGRDRWTDLRWRGRSAEREGVWRQAVWDGIPFSRRYLPPLFASPPTCTHFVHVISQMPSRCSFPGSQTCFKLHELTDVQWNVKYVHVRNSLLSTSECAWYVAWFSSTCRLRFDERSSFVAEDFSTKEKSFKLWPTYLKQILQY